MNLFLSRFNATAQVVLQDVMAASQSTEAKRSLSLYLARTRTSLSKYHHHLGMEVNDDELAVRYYMELAILHLATTLIEEVLGPDNGNLGIAWPVNNECSYSWYRVAKKDIKTQVQQVATELDDVEVPQLAIIDAADKLLTQTAPRFIGEFYTPLNLVEHLIDISRFNPAALLAGAKVVDPACGGGMVLVSVVHAVIQYVKEHPILHATALNAISNNIYGYDIQPFAVTLARTMLLSLIWPFIQEEDQHVSRLHVLENVQLKDPLAAHAEFWIEPRFDFVIGNPPFMSVKKSSIDFIDAYDEVLYGHPNLYVLFLWWSVKVTKAKGIVSLLLPQSLFTGNYYKLLRTKLKGTTCILSLTRMIDRKGVVGAADQQMMAVALVRLSTQQEPTNQTVTLKVARNGTDIRDTEAIIVNHAQVVQNVNSSTIWIVSDNIIDYEVEESLQTTSNYLGSYDHLFSFGNGGYVWNQNKELLRKKPEADTIPLVSAASISLFQFQFPYRGTHATRKRPYSKTSTKLAAIERDAPALLIQRTTPRKVGRRLVCSLPGSDFYEKYPKYFLENHVNFVNSTSNTLSLLYGLLGWLNSDLINFVFQLRNGNTQVSLYELQLLPLRVDILEEVASVAELAMCAIDDDQRQQHIFTLNETIFNLLGFTQKHKDRVKQVLSRRESVKK